MAVGIVEKGNSGLFDNEIEFNGKYATMVRFLKEDLGLFSTFREAYVISSIVGFLNNKKYTEDNQEKVQAASIFPNELNKRKPDLRFIYRLIMLLKEEKDYTLEDYKNRTFRDDRKKIWMYLNRIWKFSILMRAVELSIYMINFKIATE